MPDGTVLEARTAGVALECPKTWERLEAAGEKGTRHCKACDELVYEAWSEREALEHVERGRCVVQMFISLSARGRPKVPGRPPVAELLACPVCGVVLDPRQTRCDKCSAVL